MALIDWSDTYSVGIDVFDGEHKKLIAIINHLHDAFETGMDRTVTGQALDELVDYTMVHFAHEEEVFEAWGYPDKAAHKIAHQELREQVREYHAAIAAKGSIEMALELIRFLRFWLLGHIMADDKKFCAFLIEKGYH